MSAQSGAWSAAVDTAGERHSIFNSAIRAAFLAASIAAAGCTPATTRVAGADPADPAARTKAVGYRSAIAPYTALRPSAPAPWRERNERVAPRTGREQP
jgi:hypothetical protein